MAQDRIIQAAGLILGYAMIIGCTDNFVRFIADEAGLWQFHATRTALALTLLWALSRPLGLRLRPVHWRGVVARSTLHGLAMMIYFGALAFLPVALVAAGLFTAPIFVLVIARLAYGEPIGPLGLLAVALGFGGAMLVLGPQALAGASLPSVLPVLAGLFYAIGNIATRAWCGEESTETLLMGFFAALGLLGLLGMIALTLFPFSAIPSGADGFLMRGPILPSSGFWFWVVVQACGALFGVSLMVRAYQLAPATKVSVLEYAILPASALWSWVIWGDILTPLAILGMAMIAAAGVLITLGRPQAANGAA